MVEKKYIVHDRRTGAFKVIGSAKECAKAIGTTYNSFLTMVSRSRRGIGIWNIQDINPSAEKSPAEIWDAAIYRPNKYRCSGNPCLRCPWRSLCRSMDTFCRDWADWYGFLYDDTARVLKARAK